MRRIFFICIFTTKSRPVISVIYCHFLHLVQSMKKKKLRIFLLGKHAEQMSGLFFALSILCTLPLRLQMALTASIH